MKFKGLILITLFVVPIKASYNDFINTTVGLLANLNTSVAVTALICWDSDDAVQLIKSLNVKNFMVTIRQPSSDNFPSYNEHHNYIILDMACEHTKGLLLQIAFEEIFRYKIIVLDTMENASELTVLEFFKDFNVLPSSELFYFVQKTDGILVNQLYRTSINSELIEEIYGKWSKENNSFTDLRLVKITSRRRQNLRKTNLKASMVITNNDTLNHLDDYHDQHIDTITKVNYILTNYLIHYLNATVNYSIVSTWGYKDNETGDWSGMIGELVTKKADLGASPLFFTTDRVEIIDYIACTSETRSKFIFRSPKLSYTDNVFLLPFDSNVWLSLGALMLVGSVILFIAAGAEWKSNLTQNDPNDSSILKPNFYESFFLIICGFCQQGSFALPKSFPARIITMLCFTAMMFMYASYSANIVALLQSPSSKIRTLQDLYNSRLKFGVDDTVFNHFYFSHAVEPLRRAIYENKIRQKNGNEAFMNLAQGVEQVREGLFAFHMELGVGYKIISETFQEDEKCGLQEIQYLQVIDPFYAIQKNSSYKELFKIGLLRMHEHGLQERENSLLYTKKPKCSGRSAKFISVSIVDIEPAIYIFLYGVGLSFVIFLTEILIHKIGWYTVKNQPVASRK
ncbi:unnamed protein product [Diamesa tonsa]